MMPGGAAIHHPAGAPVLQGDLEAFLESERYVTEDRMRGIVNTIVRDAIEEFNTNRDRAEALLQWTNELTAEFDARVVEATSGIGNEVTARDPQLRGHIDTAARQNTESLDLMQQKMAENLEILKSEIGVFIQEKQHQLSMDVNAKAQILYEQAQSAGLSHGGKGDGGQGPSRERNIYDVRDYKIADLEKGASTAYFKKRKHDLELYLDHRGILVGSHKLVEALSTL